MPGMRPCTHSDRLPRLLVRARAVDGTDLCMTLVRPPGTRAEDSPRPAVLLVHGFGQNRYLFDMPGRSFAAHLAHGGFDAYVLELRGHGLSRTRGGAYATSVADYSELDLPAAVAALRARGANDVVLCGHSMGGVACMTAPTALLRTVRAVVAIASPTHIGRGAESLRAFAKVGTAIIRASARTRWGRGFDTGLMAGLFRRALPLFNAPIPWPLHIWVPGQIEDDILHAYLSRAFEAEPKGVVFDFGRWLEGRSFDRTAGGESSWSRLRSMPVPILFVAGAQDLIVPPESIEPGFALTKAPHKTLLLFGDASHRGRYGHTDLLLGRHAPQEVWPPILRWLVTAGAGVRG